MTWELSSKIEHQVARIITQQEINGWAFDKALAERHISYLNTERQRLYDSIRGDLGYDRYLGTGTVEKPFTKAGVHIQRVQKYWGQETFEIVQGPYTPIWYEDPDLGSRQKLQCHLERLGWKPRYYTDKGNPKIEEESLSSIKGELGKSLARWYILSHRQHQIEGWLESLRDDGRITAGANPCGTPTGRMRHNTVVNVPKAKPSVIFGKEMRELFIAEDGYTLVGYDAKGLEARILAHYMNDPEFTEVVLGGDIHDFFQEKIGLDDRDTTKTFEYAFFYGAKDAKLGSILGGNAKDGEEARARLLGSVPKLGSLIRRVEEAAGKGYLIGLDGRKMPIRKRSAALNTLSQGGGAIAMKMAMIYLDKYCRINKLGLDLVKKVGDYHDEGDFEVKNNSELVELFSSLAVKAVSESGKYFNLRCPLEASVKCGPNWAECH